MSEKEETCGGKKREIRREWNNDKKIDTDKDSDKKKIKLSGGRSKSRPVISRIRDEKKKERK